MGEPAKKMHRSYAEYLELERETGVRHEWLDGEAWAMAGGTPRLSKVKTNLTCIVHLALRDRQCQPYDSDLKIRVLDTGLAQYPDLSVICGPLELDPQDPNAVTNPTVLVEVLSRGTEAWDRGGKFAHDRRIPSLQHVVFIDPEVVRVEVYTRVPEGTWSLADYHSGQLVQLPAIGISFPVDEVYANLPPPPAESEEATPQPPPPRRRAPSR